MRQLSNWPENKAATDTSMPPRSTTRTCVKLPTSPLKLHSRTPCKTSGTAFGNKALLWSSTCATSKTSTNIIGRTRAPRPTESLRSTWSASTFGRKTTWSARSILRTTTPERLAPSRSSTSWPGRRTECRQTWSRCWSSAAKSTSLIVDVLLQCWSIVTRAMLALEPTVSSTWLWTESQRVPVRVYMWTLTNLNDCRNQGVEHRRLARTPPWSAHGHGRERGAIQTCLLVCGRRSERLVEESPAATAVKSPSHYHVSYNNLQDHHLILSPP